MKSKIKAINGNGTYDSQYGTLYKFEYEFEDGTILTANHKSENSPFKVGDEAEYEVKGSNNHGSWGKVTKPDSGGGYGGGGKFDTRGIEVGHAITNAVQLAISDLDTTVANIEKRAREILALCAKLKGETPKQEVKEEKWSDGTPVKSGNIEQNFKEEAVSQLNNESEDDLPF